MTYRLPPANDYSLAGDIAFNTEGPGTWLAAALLGATLAAHPGRTRHPGTQARPRCHC